MKFCAASAVCALLLILIPVRTEEPTMISQNHLMMCPSPNYPIDANSSSFYVPSTATRVKRQLLLGMVGMGVAAVGMKKVGKSVGNLAKKTVHAIRRNLKGGGGGRGRGRGPPRPRGRRPFGPSRPGLGAHGRPMKRGGGMRGRRPVPRPGPRMDGGMAPMGRGRGRNGKEPRRNGQRVPPPYGMAPRGEFHPMGADHEPMPEEMLEAPPMEGQRSRSVDGAGQDNEEDKEDFVGPPESGEMDFGGQSHRPQPRQSGHPRHQPFPTNPNRRLPPPRSQPPQSRLSQGQLQGRPPLPGQRQQPNAPPQKVGLIPPGPGQPRPQPAANYSRQMHQNVGRPQGSHSNPSPQVIRPQQQHRPIHPQIHRPPNVPPANRRLETLPNLKHQTKSQPNRRLNTFAPPPQQPLQKMPPQQFQRSATIKSAPFHSQGSFAQRPHIPMTRNGTQNRAKSLNHEADEEKEESEEAKKLEEGRRQPMSAPRMGTRPRGFGQPHQAPSGLGHQMTSTRPSGFGWAKQPGGNHESSEEEGEKRGERMKSAAPKSGFGQHPPAFGGPRLQSQRPNATQIHGNMPVQSLANHQKAGNENSHEGSGSGEEKHGNGGHKPAQGLGTIGGGGGLFGSGRLGTNRTGTNLHRPGLGQGFGMPRAATMPNGKDSQKLGFGQRMAKSDETHNRPRAGEDEEEEDEEGEGEGHGMAQHTGHAGLGTGHGTGTGLGTIGQFGHLAGPPQHGLGGGGGFGAHKMVNDGADSDESEAGGHGAHPQDGQHMAQGFGTNGPAQHPGFGGHPGNGPAGFRHQMAHLNQQNNNHGLSGEEESGEEEEEAANKPAGFGTIGTLGGNLHGPGTGAGLGHGLGAQPNGSNAFFKFPMEHIQHKPERNGPGNGHGQGFGAGPALGQAHQEDQGNGSMGMGQGGLGTIGRGQANIAGHGFGQKTVGHGLGGPHEPFLGMANLHGTAPNPSPGLGTIGTHNHPATMPPGHMRPSQQGFGAQQHNSVLPFATPFNGQASFPSMGQGQFPLQTNHPQPEVEEGFGAHEGLWKGAKSTGKGSESVEEAGQGVPKGYDWRAHGRNASMRNPALHAPNGQKDELMEDPQKLAGKLVDSAQNDLGQARNKLRTALTYLNPPNQQNAVHFPHTHQTGQSNQQKPNTGVPPHPLLSQLPQQNHHWPHQSPTSAQQQTFPPNPQTQQYSPPTPVSATNPLQSHSMATMPSSNPFQPNPMAPAPMPSAKFQAHPMAQMPQHPMAQMPPHPMAQMPSSNPFQPHPLAPKPSPSFFQFPPKLGQNHQPPHQQQQQHWPHQQQLQQQQAQQQQLNVQHPNPGMPLAGPQPAPPQNPLQTPMNSPQQANFQGIPNNASPAWPSQQNGPLNSRGMASSANQPPPPQPPNSMPQNQQPRPPFLHPQAMMRHNLLPQQRRRLASSPAQMHVLNKPLQPNIRPTTMPLSMMTRRKRK